MLEQAAAEGGSNKQSEMNVCSVVKCVHACLTHLQEALCIWPIRRYAAFIFFMLSGYISVSFNLLSLYI